MVKTGQGELRGAKGGEACRFLGVPFAAPPVGAGRLLPPRSAAPWEGVRDATRPGPAPPQVAPPDGAGPEWDTFAFGEECLNLNVWTPDPAAVGLPVMVWIQGGAFEIGSQAAYDGTAFARDGVVCVVINWRVGAEGFLHLGDGVSNCGLLDQVAALEWVQENVAAFGGDPGNVTVFGQSAGAMSIGCLLALPRARGLFRRAVLQSGSPHHVITADLAERIGRRLAERLDVPPERDALAALPLERFLAAQAELKADLLARPDPAVWGEEVVASGMLWQPVVDGAVLPERPMDRIRAGSGAQVDLLVGTNTDDWKMFLLVTGALGQVTEQMLTGPVEVFGPWALAAYGVPVEETLAAYRSRYPGAGPGDLLSVVQTDWWVRLPAIRLADAYAGAGRTYMYEFAWASSVFGAAMHALEVPFVFDTLGPDVRLFGPLLGDDAPQELADTMHAAWVSFAATGDPGWPRYDLSRRSTMRFDTTSAVVEDPRAWERSLWEGVR